MQLVAPRGAWSYLDNNASCDCAVAVAQNKAAHAAVVDKPLDGYAPQQPDAHDGCHTRRERARLHL